ncbi:MAG: hypothetical protein ACX94D_15275 [Henriciella sp.]
MQFPRVTADSINPDDFAAYVSHHELCIFAPTGLQFGNPSSPDVEMFDADVELWARASYWEPDEIVALALGKNPSLVNSETCYPRQSTFGLCRQFVEWRELVQRAVITQDLFPYTTPAGALSWLATQEMSHPPALVERVRKFGVSVNNWREEYDGAMRVLNQLAERLDSSRVEHLQTEAELKNDLENWRELGARAMEQLEVTEREATEANQQLALLRSELSSRAADFNSRPSDRSSLRRKNTSLLKLVFGMARGGYSYDPTDPDPELLKSILDDLNFSGVPLDIKTVRKHLLSASELASEVNRK